MFLQEGRQFLLKRCFAMMLNLLVDVGYGVIDAGNANGKSGIPFLPFEWDEFGKCLVNPFGGIAFEQLHRLGD